MSDLSKEVRNAACLFAELGRSLGRIAELLEHAPDADAEDAALEAALAVPEAMAAPEPEPEPVAEPEPEPEVEPEPELPPPPEAPRRRLTSEELEAEFDRFAERALTFIRRAGDEGIRPRDLVQLLRPWGFEAQVAQGFHWALIRALNRHAVVELVDGALVELKPDAGGEAAPEPEPAPEPLEPEPAVEQARPRAPDVAVVEVQWPWDELVEKAEALLRAEPSRTWAQGELSTAVRNSGIAVPRARGMHFGLVARLKERGTVAEDTEGRLRWHEGTPPAPPAQITATPPLIRRAQPAPVPAQAVEPPPAQAEPPAPAAPEPQPETRVASPAPPATPFDELWDEVDLGAPYLEFLSREHRNAQLSIWAGRARMLQDQLGLPASGEGMSQTAYRLFGTLKRLVYDHSAGWVDALSRKWSTDWSAYVRWHQSVLSGFEPDLPQDALESLWRDLLRGLENPDRSVSTETAAHVVAEGLEYLDPSDGVLAHVARRFNVPLTQLGTRRARPRPERTDDADAVAVAPVSPEVLAATRGKRALLLGGQGTREPQRQALLSTLELAGLDWVTAEKNQASHFEPAAQRVEGGSYDLVLFLAAFSSHKGGDFLRRCKAARVPVVYLNRGYGVNSVVEAVRQQLPRQQAGTGT